METRERKKRVEGFSIERETSQKDRDFRVVRERTNFDRLTLYNTLNLDSTPDLMRVFIHFSHS